MTDDTHPEAHKPDIGVGSPAYLELVRFGEVLHDVFGARAYLVGSATRGKDFRDVDVRVMLEDGENGEYWRWFPGGGMGGNDPKWNGICVAFSYYGAKMTGLNIDFQVQPITEANVLYGSEFRQPLMLIDPPSERSDDDRT